MSRRLPSISRALLLKVMDDATHEIYPRAANVCGFEPGEEMKNELKPIRSGDHPCKTEPLVGKKQPTEPSKETPPSPRPSLMFIQPTNYELLEPLPTPQPDTSLPYLTNRELGTRYDRPVVPSQPLTRWSRLAPFLRRALGATLPSHRVDTRALERHLASGLALTSLPRLSRQTWAPQAVVLKDTAWREMSPFATDVQALLARLELERGSSGLLVLDVDGPPPRRHFRRIPPGVPVLVLSTLDQYEADAARLAAWRLLAGRLSARGQSFQALSPCPRRLWRREIASTWPMAVWDCHARLPRRTARQKPLPATSGATAATSDLLDLLAPAAFVEPPLLRSTRLLLGRPADVGSEWQAWFHSSGWASGVSFGLVRPKDESSTAAQAARLARRSLKPHAAAVDLLISQQHQRHSPLIELESQLRSAFSQGDAATALASSLNLLHRIVARLRQMADTPGFIDDVESHIAPWFVDMVDRIPPALRAAPSLRQLVGEGLGLAHRFLQTQVITWPVGTDTESAQHALDAHSAALPGLLTYRLVLGGWPEASLDFKQALLLPPQAGMGTNEMPLGTLRANLRPLHLTLSPPKGAPKQITRLLSTFEEPLPDIQAAGLVTASLSSNLERRQFAFTARPVWAKRMWYDRYGLAAEFRIRDVPFGLRWIPPGSFLMGSPEDEPGRRENEGPPHRVTITKGYWMAETPVTQAQWRAVVEAARENAPLWNRLVGKKDALNPAPSHFQGPPELPVESVSWEDCAAFCQMLDSLLPEGPGFHLPTEAQWEYACRAGDEAKVPFQGPISLEGDVLSPDLEDYAWYGGNSGKDCVVSNPQDSSKWLGKEHGSPTAGTHPVKSKQSNAIGLHDMLGTVWEWCADEWDEKAYAKRAHGVKDPRMDATDDSADRVVRGGSWYNKAQNCRAAFRFGVHPGIRWVNQGLRLAAGQNEPRAAEPQPKERSDLLERRSRARRAGGSEPA